MSAIWSITTHHEKPEEAAEAWKECSVSAIGGYGRGLGNLKRAAKSALHPQQKLFLEMKKGDLVLAYTGKNRIACVGTIADGKYMYETKNKVAAEFDYRNQFRVD